jgi:hypothetical protein
MTDVARRFRNHAIPRILTCMAALTLLVGTAAQAREASTFTVSSEPEVVYRWKTQRCDTKTIPDSPARAYRREDGSLVMIASHFNNRIFEGRDFDDLRPNCSVQSMGKESANPADLDDRFWVQSLIPLGGGRVMAMASHEFLGTRHAGVCEKGAPWPSCWYLSVVGLEADERDFAFKLLPRDQRMIAGSNQRFDPSVKAGGFHTVTNTVFDGDYAYFMAWTEDAAVPGGKGNCLFRAPRSDLVNGWQMLSKGQFVHSPDPYPTDGQAPIQASCDRLGGPDMAGKARSIVWLEGRKQWMVVWSSRANADGPGIYYATSDDLRNWSLASLLAPLAPFWGTKETGTFYEYPSLIDHGSKSQIFQTVGNNFYLYLTRLNWEEKRALMDRDLVRFKVTVD